MREIVKRFSRSIFVDFKYVKPNTDVKVWGAQGGGKNARRARRDQVYPAIRLFNKSSGSLQ